MKEYVVIKDILNIRSKPSDESDDTYLGQLTQGESVFLDPKPIEGKTPFGGTSNNWLSDNVNRLVSADGVVLKDYAYKKSEFINDPFVKSNNLFTGDGNNENNWKISWGHIDLEIWKIWRDYHTKGKGVKVAIIDTGVMSDSNDLKGRISNLSVSVLASPHNTLKDEDTSNHGTRSAGLIGANGGNCNTVFGVAPECEVIVIKTSATGFYPPNLVKALNKAVELGAHIVSMSLEMYSWTFTQFPTDKAAIETIIKNASASGTLFVASCGDRGDSELAYPASMPGCLSIGAYKLDDNNARVIHPNNNKNNPVCLLSPGDRLRSCSPNAASLPFGQSSAAAAFTSGVLALAIAATGKPVTHDLVMSAIQQHNACEPILDETLPSVNQGWGVLSPARLINCLNT